MIVIPAVDLKEGKPVRLAQGRAEEVTVYGEDPLDYARRWQAEGAPRLHVVDLDGALAGTPKNLAHTKRILAAVDIPVQVGGGVRSPATVDELLAAGAARVILGTKAIEDQEWFGRLVRARPDQIILGLDAKEGRVVTRGWQRVFELPATELLAELRGLPLAEVIYTDVAADGMLAGPNLAGLERVLERSPFPVIAAGGVSTPEDVRAVAARGAFGVIVGKALYEGRMSLSAALAAAAAR